MNARPDQLTAALRLVRELKTDPRVKLVKIGRYLDVLEGALEQICVDQAAIARAALELVGDRAELADLKSHLQSIIGRLT